MNCCYLVVLALPPFWFSWKASSVVLPRHKQKSISSASSFCTSNLPAFSRYSQSSPEERQSYLVLPRLRSYPHCHQTTEESQQKHNTGAARLLPRGGCWFVSSQKVQAHETNAILIVKWWYDLPWSPHVRHHKKCDPPFWGAPKVFQPRNLWLKAIHSLVACGPNKSLLMNSSAHRAQHKRSLKLSRHLFLIEALKESQFRIWGTHRAPESLVVFHETELFNSTT